MSSDEKLRECPFCGSEAEIVKLSYGKFGGANGSIYCTNKECVGSFGRGVDISIEKVIDSWNTRPMQDSWIPVSERLPEERDVEYPESSPVYDVTIQYSAESNIVGELYYNYDTENWGTWYFVEEERRWCVEEEGRVIAWKPKSAPYIPPAAEGK